MHNKIRKAKFEDKSWKGILVGYEPNGYKVWDVKSENLGIVKDVIADEINFLASRPEMRVQGVIVGNFNKTDENDVFEKSVDSHKSDNEKSDIFLGNESEESESDEPEPRRNKSSNRKLDKSNKSVIETNKHNQSKSHDNENKKINNKQIE